MGSTGPYKEYISGFLEQIVATEKSKNRDATFEALDAHSSLNGIFKGCIREDAISFSDANKFIHFLRFVLERFDGVDIYTKKKDDEKRDRGAICRIDVDVAMCDMHKEFDVVYAELFNSTTESLEEDSEDEEHESGEEQECGSE